MRMDKPSRLAHHLQNFGQASDGILLAHDAGALLPHNQQQVSQQRRLPRCAQPESSFQALSLLLKFQRIAKLKYSSVCKSEYLPQSSMTFQALDACGALVAMMHEVHAQFGLCNAMHTCTFVCGAPHVK